MKVIHSTDTHELQCSHCKSTLEIERADLKYHYNFGHHSYLYVECPVCDRQGEVTGKDLPKRWERYANALIAEHWED
jgi:hypothetical protein